MTVILTGGTTATNQAVPVAGTTPITPDAKGGVGVALAPMFVGPTTTNSVMSMVGTTSSREDNTSSIVGWSPTSSGSSSGLFSQNSSSRATVAVEVRGSILRDWTLPTMRLGDEYAVPEMDSLNITYQTVQPLARSHELHIELAKVEQDLSRSFKSDTFVVGSAMAVTSGLGVGYVIWLVRGGLIMTSLLAQVPAWQDIDPLTVLDSRGLREEDGESLQSLIEDSDDEELMIS